MISFRSILLVVCVLLSGCTQKFSDTNATIKEALFGFEDTRLSAANIEAIPYASSYFKINDGPQIFMVLAFVENSPTTGKEQLKWLSNDKAMIVTENGRIIKTVNLPGANLEGITTNPKQKHFHTSNYSWSAIYDWQPNYRFNIKSNNNTQPIRELTHNSLLWSEMLTIWEEKVTFNSLSTTMTNHFWVNSEGSILKSSQWLIPGKLYIEQEVLKPYKG
ncbi:YjbF family lipoprotein [Vibrio ouci]|nr:YjbF family lipoprotein [Vibrio ouci]